MNYISKAPLWILLCLFSLSHTTETALTAALPNISSSFNVTGGIAQLCSSIYFLGFSTGILLLGRISDIYGRRPVVLTGMSLYLFATIISIFAPNIKILIILRFIQAFGASVGSVVAQAMARDCYQGRELTSVYSTLAVALSLVPSIGAAMGGYIVEYAGWRYVFTTLSLISFTLLCLYSKYLPETNQYIASSSNNSYLAVFKVAIQDKILLLYAFIVGAFNGIAFGFYMEAPFIFINKVGIHPSSYGKLTFLLSFSNAIGSIVNKYLITKFIRSRKIMTLGLMFSFIGCSILLLANFLNISIQNKQISIALVFVPMMLHMFGHSLLISFCLRYAIADYTKVSGTAGSIFGSIYYFITAAISFLVSKIHGDNIVKFTLLFFILSVASNISFWQIRNLIKTKTIPEFN